MNRRTTSHLPPLVMMITALILLSAFTPPATAARLTLPGAVEAALKKSPDIQSAREAISLATSQIDTARAIWWPKIAIYAEALRADAPSLALFKTIDQRLLEPGTDFNNPGIIDNIEGGLTAEIFLYNAGRNHLKLAAAHSTLEVTKARQRKTQHRLTAQVIDIWYDILSSRKFIHIAEESLQTVTAQLASTTIRYKGGSVLRSDLLSLKVRLAEAEEQLLASKNRLSLSKAALFTLLGEDPDTTDPLSPEDPFPGGTPPPYPEGLAHALSHRCEIEESRALIAHADTGIHTAQSGHRPIVTLGGRVYANDNSLDHQIKRANWSMALRMDLPLFSGFSVDAETRAARAHKRTTEALRQKIRLQIRWEVKNAYLRHDEAIKRVHVAQKAVALGEESLSLVKKQVEGGSATVTRYLEAELDRNSARIRETSAYYEMKKSLAAIFRTTATSDNGPGTLFALCPPPIRHREN